ncbi:MAG: mandelate racemase/muconate lactonizing enzyme family protein [Rubrobacter sp.]|nr:mandelate racemase/muconate lactonizing enzyme family protein [Rubrobacter sp.]
MEITNIRLKRIETKLDPPFHAAWDPVPRRSFEATLVFVDTDEGITGVASGDTMSGFEEYEHLFVGKDSLRISRHVRTLETIALHAGKFWPVEAALWDILGKVAGQSVATLFGGSEEKIPAYASCGELKPPEERAESALALREEGFRAMKIRIAPNRLEEGIKTVEAARGAVGDTMEIMVDLNEAWRMAGDTSRSIDPKAARDIAERLEELDVFWLEEPLPLTDIEGLRSIRAGSGMRVAGGEMSRTTSELFACLEADTLDVYQPDVLVSIGMTRSRTIAELALAKNRLFTPHTWTNGVGVLANLHVTAGVGGGPFIEFPYDPPGWTPERRDFMLAEPLKIDDEGCLAIPGLPGLGAILDEKYS